MTRHEGRHGRQCEQCVIDDLVRAVEDGDTERKTELARLWLAAFDEDRWNRGKVIASGLFLKPAALAACNARDLAVSALWDAVDAERHCDLEEGAPISSDEIETWRQLLLAGALTDDKVYERHIGDIWGIVELTRNALRRCYVAALGWERETLEFVAVYGTRAEAMNALMAIGFVSVADYAERSLKTVSNAGE